MEWTKIKVATLLIVLKYSSLLLDLSTIRTAIASLLWGLLQIFCNTRKSKLSCLHCAPSAVLLKNTIFTFRYGCQWEIIVITRVFWRFWKILEAWQPTIILSHKSEVLDHHILKELWVVSKVNLSGSLNLLIHLIELVE
jgi:hypothetical protein